MIPGLVLKNYSTPIHHIICAMLLSFSYHSDILHELGWHRDEEHKRRMAEVEHTKQMESNDMKNTESNVWNSLAIKLKQWNTTLSNNKYNFLHLFSFLVLSFRTHSIFEWDFSKGRELNHNLILSIIIKCGSKKWTDFVCMAGMPVCVCVWI